MVLILIEVHFDFAIQFSFFDGFSFVMFFLSFCERNEYLDEAAVGIDFERDNGSTFLYEGTAKEINLFFCEEEFP